MGIFADRCDAYVGPDGKALSGEALEAAKLDRKAKRCGHTVRKAARFCSKCGRGAPGGWWKCPNCKEWCGNESQFCWNCSTPLHPEDRMDLGGGVWQRKPGIYAQRFDYDVKKLTAEGLLVQTGQAAIFLDGGKVAGSLGPGRHFPNTIARSVNWWGDPPPRSLIMVETGDIILPVRVTDLRTSEEIAVEYYGEIVMRHDPKAEVAFVANLMKEQRQLTCQEVGEAFKREIRLAVMDVCQQATIDDLFKDPMRRLKLEDAIQATLKVACERYGFIVERISASEFTGPAYEKLRAQKGDLEVKRQEAEFTQRMRELVTSDRMGELAEQNRLADYVASLAQERGVSKAKMDHELALLQQVQRHEITAADASFKMRQELEKTGHDIGLKSQWDDYNRDKIVKDAEAKTEETMKWLEVKKQKNLEEERQAQAFAELIGGKSPEEMVLLVPEADKRADLLKIVEMKMKAGMSPEAMVAFIADKNPAALESLARQKSVEASELRRILDDYKRMNEEAFDRGERTFAKGMEAAVEAAKRPGVINQNVRHD